MKFTLVFSFTLFFLTACDSNKLAKKSIENAPNTHRVPTNQILNDLSEKAIADLALIEIDSTAIPRTIENGKFKGTKSKSWTSGFYPGLLWQLYGYSRNEKLKEAAVTWSNFIEKEKWDDGTHDLGFKIYCPFGNAYKITNEDRYKQIYTTAGKTLCTRYNTNVKAIRSWDHHEHLWKFPVIIDNMMNLELVFETAISTDDSTYYKIADHHATTTLKNHFRDDYSSYHVVDYDTETGAIVNRHTHQGKEHESAWSRGQAWGLYGFTVAYRYTKNELYLDQAKRIAEYIYTHPNLPDDLIPYWDYDVTDVSEPRDVSAAAVAASGLLELQHYVPQESSKYIKWAEGTLKSIASEKYKLEIAPFFIKHSTGSVPGEFEIDSPIIYAEYYYTEALIRLNEYYKS